MAGGEGMKAKRVHVFTPTGAIRAWASILIVILGFGLALGFTIAYVTKVDKEAERRNVERSRDICGIIKLIDDRNQKLHPSSAEQKQFVDELHRYRLKLGC
jgi:hypothetical protein